MQLIEFAHHGYIVVAAVVDEYVVSPLDKEWEQQMFSVVNEENGFYLFHDFKVGDYDALRAYIDAIDLDVKFSAVIPVVPYPILKEVEKISASDYLMAQFDCAYVNQKHFELLDDGIFMQPAMLVSAVWPYVTEDCRIGFLQSPLFSNEDNHIGKIFAMRRSFAALANLIKGLSLELPHGVVMGIFPGLFTPGYVPYHSVREIQHNFITTFLKATNEAHNGKVLKYTMEVLPF
jgi:hypothetical protein